MSIPGSGNPSLDLALTRDISSNDKLTANEKKKFRVVNRGSFFKDAWHELGEMYKRNPLVKRRRAEKFRIAAISGDLELLRTAVEDWEIDVNDKNKDGQTALYCAAREGRSKVVTVLCADEGADVNLLTETNGRSALWWACYNGDLPIVECLVQHGATVNLPDQDGRSPLWTAANNNHIHIIQYLLSKGGDLNQSDNDGETALWFAAYTGRHKTVTALLKLGADMEKKCNNGKKPRDVALNFLSQQALDKENARRLSQQRAKHVFQKELEIALHQSLKRSKSKLLQSSSINSSHSRQQSRLARNTWAGATVSDNENDDEEDEEEEEEEDDDNDTNIPFNASSHSFSSATSVHLSFRTTPRSTPGADSPTALLSPPMSPSGVSNKPSSWNVLKKIKFHSLKILESDEAVEQDVSPYQPNNTPFRTPSHSSIHTPFRSSTNSPISMSPFMSPNISRASSNAQLEDLVSPYPNALLPTSYNNTISTTDTTPTTSLVPSSSPLMNTPDEIIQKTLYKIQSTRAQKQNATQVLLKRVQSSRAALKQELDTSKEVLETLSRKKDEIAQKRLLRQQSRHMRETM